MNDTPPPADDGRNGREPPVNPQPGSGQANAGRAAPGPLSVTPALQAVLRAILPSGTGGPAALRLHDIAAAAGLSRPATNAVLARLAAAGWARTWKTQVPGRGPTARFWVLLPAAVPAARQAVATETREKLSVRVLAVLADAGRPLTTAEIAAAAAVAERKHSCETALDNHRTAGRAVSRKRTRGPLTWAITPAGRDWLARGGDPGGKRQTTREGLSGMRALRVLTDAPGPLTASQVSAALGGRPGASSCAARLAGLRDKGLVARSGNRPPWTWEPTPAGRQAAAQEPSLPGHGTNRPVAGCRCSWCTARRAREARTAKKANDLSRDAAFRHGEQWTGTQLEIVSRDDLTLDQIATITGRTRHAVQNARQRLRNEPEFRGIRDGSPPTSTGTGRRPRPPFAPRTLRERSPGRETGPSKRVPPAPEA